MVDWRVMDAIYGLVDPVTHHLRYVGRSNRPGVRWQEHCKGKGRTHCAAWVSQLARDGLQPEYFVIETVPPAESGEAERFWINYFRYIGAPLTNHAPGGFGGSRKGHTMSPEANARRIAASVAACKGKKLSPEHVEKMAAAKRGKKHTPEHNAKIGLAHKGRVKSEQECLNISAAQRGKSKPVGTGAKISAAKIGKPLSAAHKAALSAARKGRVFSEETKQKIAESNRATFARKRDILRQRAAGMADVRPHMI